jgi:GNAT superfamily N-acetyltransferase
VTVGVPTSAAWAQARGAGLGRKLVEALDTAEQPLVCVAVQNAHGFWERMGFARKGPAEEFGYGEASAVMVRDVHGTDAGKGDEGVAGAGKVAP